MTDYVAQARVAAQAVGDEQARKLALQQQTLELALINYEREHGVAATQALARVFNADASDPEFAPLQWKFEERPIVTKEGKDVQIRPKHGAHFTVETEFQGIPITVTAINGPGGQHTVHAVKNGGTSQGFNDLEGFGSAVNHLYPSLDGP